MFPMYSSLIYHLSHPGQVPQSTCCLHPWQLENLTTGDKSPVTTQQVNLWLVTVFEPLCLYMFCHLCVAC